jgi:hypothetical protein
MVPIMSDAPPQLSYRCPIPWQTMSRTERGRFCSECQRDIPNLSLMTRTEREAFLTRAESAPVCAAFFTHLSGDLATLETLATRPAWRVVQTGIASAALGTLVLGSGCATLKTDEPSPQQETRTDTAVALTPFLVDETVVLMAYGMFACPSQKPARRPKPPGK